LLAAKQRTITRSADPARKGSVCVEIGEETIALLASVAGIDVPAEDRAELAQALRTHLETFRDVEALDLNEFDAAGTFDPRWDG
jgi:hypothetical protein